MQGYVVYLLFALGFALLVKGADFLVEGASSIAKRFNVPDIVVGLTIVSFGTSMPELVVNLMASFNPVEGSEGIALGNVIGSNIANILLILGISACIFPLPIQRSTALTEIPFSISATLLVGFLANMELFEGQARELSHWDGLGLLLYFGLFIIYVIKIVREEPETVDPIVVMPPWRSMLYVVLGMFGLYFGGKWVVQGAIEIALDFGMSQKMVGLTVVAIGTSLPELAASAMAAYKRKTDIAVGNVVGSNIFNLLWILGVSASIKPLPVDLSFNQDMLILLVTSLLLLMWLDLKRGDKSLGMKTGVSFLLLYGAYLTFVVIRG